MDDIVTLKVQFDMFGNLFEIHNIGIHTAKENQK